MAELLKLIDPETQNQTYYEEYPSSNPRFNLILIHGMGAPTQRWAETAKFFAPLGFHVYCLGLKGYGRAPGKPGHVKSFDVYYNDLKFLMSHARKKLNGPTFVMGESLGALIALGFELKFPRLAEGIVTIAPALKDKLDIPLWKKLYYVFLLFVNQAYPIPMPWNPEMITRDAQSLKILKTDPDEQHHVASPRMLLENLLVRGKVIRQAGKIKTPLLILQGGHDALMDYRMAEKFSKKIGPTCTYRFYTEMYHAMSVDTGREKMFQDVLDWMQKTAQALS